tara:strand:+ start:242 stop:2314 length:2073 start_codon:yes stop_codon:yes gene_type:complete
MPTVNEKKINELIKEFNKKNFLLVEDETDKLLKNDKKSLILLTLNASACSNLNKYQKAEKVFVIGLNNYPKSEDLNNNYVNFLINRNNFKKAIEIGEKALNAGVTNSNILNGIGLAYSNLNKIDNAIGCFKKSLRLDSSNINASYNLANCFRNKKKYVEAEKYYNDTLDINPNFAQALNGYGLLFYEQNKINDAEKLFLKAVESDPILKEAYNNLGNLMLTKKDYLSAIKFFNQALAIDENFYLAYYNRGNVFRKLHEFQAAINDYNKTLEFNESLQEVYLNLGICFLELHDHKNALAVYNKGLSLGENAEIISNIGIVYKNLGDSKLARKFFEHALRIEPDNFVHHRHLSLITKYNKKNKHIDEMNKLDAQYQGLDENKVHLFFSLAKAYDDKEEYKLSSKFYLKGNELQRNLKNYNLEKDKLIFKSIKEHFSSNYDTAYKSSLSKDDPKMIFIIGMPRSGTSLLEQILSSHSKVYGADELIYLSNSVVKNFNRPDSQEFLRFDSNRINATRKNYFDYISDMRITNKYIIDKNPFNFLWVGFIKLIFPDATVINSKRSLLDNFLSIYQNYFPGIDWSYNLDEILDYFLLYMDLMNFWDKNLPGFVNHINYEDLIIDKDLMIRELVDVACLDWEENCLDFHKNKRIVKTASDQQVRNKIYTKSIDKWKNYKTLLNPVIDKVNNINYEQSN